MIKKLVVILAVVLLGVVLLVGYFDLRWKQAAKTPWVIFVHKENRDTSTKQDDHVPCLEKIDADYKIDEAGNLLVKAGQASRVSDSCS